MIYSEHETIELKDSSCLSKSNYEYYFPKKREKQLCYSVWKENDIYKISTGYFIGVDWIEKNIKHTYVHPKLNISRNGGKNIEVDYLKMLFSSLKHSETANLISDLVEVKWDDPQIEINQKDDMLTPFIIMDFLNVVKAIVRKGLKKSYFKVAKTLHSRIKGKMLVKQTIIMHLSKGNMLHNVCSYDEFGIDNKENQLLKKALEYIKYYMMSSPLMKNAHAVSDIINFISPAFDLVSSDIEVEEIKQMKTNTLFKEYDKGIRLGKMILKRFAYNISNTAEQKIMTPPFWIDMPVLFELHVLSLLKDCFHNDINYHLSPIGNELDFVLKSEKFKMVIDAKYIPRWKGPKMDKYLTTNVRQVSGYARLKDVYSLLNMQYPESVDCLIIYPDIDEGITSFDIDNFRKDMIDVKDYHGIYKLGVKVPIIK